MSRVMDWIEEKLAADSTLAERVDAELARLRLEQDLVALREEQGVSQRELARRVGVSQPVIAHIETGRTRNLELRTLLKIAAALNGEVEIRVRRRVGRRTRRRVARRSQRATGAAR
jgi:DNA-binding XRE family transcriptional regulator